MWPSFPSAPHLFAFICSNHLSGPVWFRCKTPTQLPAHQMAQQVPNPSEDAGACLPPRRPLHRSSTLSNWVSSWAPVLPAISSISLANRLTKTKAWRKRGRLQVGFREARELSRCLRKGCLVHPRAGAMLLPGWHFANIPSCFIEFHEVITQ